MHARYGKESDGGGDGGDDDNRTKTRQVKTKSGRTHAAQYRLNTQQSYPVSLDVGLLQVDRLDDSVAVLRIDDCPTLYRIEYYASPVYCVHRRVMSLGLENGRSRTAMACIQANKAPTKSIGRHQKATHMRHQHRETCSGSDADEGGHP